MATAQRRRSSCAGTVALVRVAVMQTTPASDVDHNLHRLADALTTAARLSADVLVTPEMFVSGYAIGADAVRAAARPVDGEHTERIASMAAAAGVAVVAGLPELADHQVFNTAVLISATGTLVTSYRKSHLYGHLDHSQFAPGDTLSEVVELAGLRVALAICFDIEFPEVARTLTRRGAHAILVPTANWLETVNTRLVPARAAENGTSVVYANYCGAEGPKRYCGSSCVVDPWGNDVVRTADDEAVLVGQITADACVEARSRIDYLGQRRPELYA